MEELYELLEKRKLVKSDQIESLVMSKLSLSEISQLKESLHNIVRRHSSPQSLQSLSYYSFYPDSDLSAQHNFCPNWDCRLYRVDRLSRFAVLYADSIYIQDYFSDYQHIPSISLMEEQYRRTFVGDIKILLHIKQLLLDGVVQFLSGYAASGAHVCPGCFSEYVGDYKNIKAELIKSFKELAAEYIASTEISVSLIDKQQNRRIYSTIISGSEDFIVHGQTRIVANDSSLPKPFREIISNINESRLTKGYHLSSEEVAKSGLIEKYIIERNDDIWIQLCLAAMSNSHLKYLTHNEINVRFLNYITKSPAINHKNEIIKNYLLYELPVVNNIPLHSLLELRKNDYDSFICYRNSINRLIQDHFVNKSDLSPSLAKEISADLIQPELSKINMKVKSFQDFQLQKAKRDIFISTGLLSFGIFSTFIIPGLALPAILASGAEAIRGVKSLHSSFQVPSEIKSSNMYFLWKLRQK